MGCEILHLAYACKSNISLQVDSRIIVAHLLQIILDVDIGLSLESLFIPGSCDTSLEKIYFNICSLCNYTKHADYLTK